MINILGPDLPESCYQGDMTALADGSAVLVGCNQIGHRFFRIFWNEDNELEWVEMKQKLRYSRYVLVSMLIPDEMTTCTTSK